MPLRSSAKFRFSSIWMKILTIYILIPYFPSPNLGTFLLRFSASFIGWSFQEAANLYDARGKLLFHISRNIEITPSKSRGKSIPGLGWVKMWQSSPTQSETNNFGNSALDSTQHNGSRILGRKKKMCMWLEITDQQNLWLLATVPSESASNCQTTSKGTCRKDSWGAIGLHIRHRPTEYEMHSTARLKILQWEVLHMLQWLIMQL